MEIQSNYLIVNNNFIWNVVQERMVQIRRNKNSGLGLSIKGGAEHKLPILISKIYKDQAADITGQLFVGDAIIKVTKFKWKMSIICMQV